MSEKIFIDKINIGQRHRKELRNLDQLARSIKKVGLLQPIVVRDAPRDQYKLVAGVRRLKVCRDLLGWATIDANIVNLDEGIQSLQAEHDENEEREPFTVSERVAIGQAIEEMLGKRQGRPAEGNVGQLARNTELAAEKAGFGSRKTYERAKEAVANGTTETVNAMDDEVIPPSAAAELSKKPPKVQKSVVKKIRKGKAKTVKQALEREPGIEEDDPPATDECGNELPVNLVDAFRRDKFKEFKKAIANAILAYIEYVKHPSGLAMRQHGRGKKVGDKFVHYHLFYLNRYLNDSQSWEKCPDCDGHAESTNKAKSADDFETVKCAKCKGRGFLTKCESKGMVFEAIRYDKPRE